MFVCFTEFFLSVILLTDGQNNAGTVQPLQAAEAAKALGVRVYTIGVGTPGGQVRVPRMSPLGMTIDFAPSMLDVKELTTMAQMTGGQFFLATDDHMRVLDQQNRPVFENLFAAGGVLAGAMRWSEKSGEGIAAASAVRAANAIGDLA